MCMCAQSCLCRQRKRRKERRQEDTLPDKENINNERNSTHYATQVTLKAQALWLKHLPWQAHVRHYTWYFNHLCDSLASAYNHGRSSRPDPTTLSYLTETNQGVPSCRQESNLFFFFFKLSMVPPPFSWGRRGENTLPLLS